MRSSKKPARIGRGTNVRLNNRGRPSNKERAGKLFRKAIKHYESKGYSGEHLEKLVTRYLYAVMRGKGGAAAVAAYLAKMGWEHAINLANESAQATQAPVKGLAGSQKLIPTYSRAIEHMTSGHNGTYTARMYRTLFVSGQSPTKTMRNLIKERGVTRRVFKDSISEDAGGQGTLRPRLTVSVGFNRKRQLLYNMFFTIAELNTLFEATDLSTATQANQIVYGNLVSTKSTYTFTNNNSFLPVKVKVYWCRLRNSGHYPQTVFNSSTSPGSPPLTQTEGAMPLYTQLTDLVTDANRSVVSVDPRSTGICAADAWKSSVQIIKTFSQKLMAGDKWTFDYIHRFGPGIRLDRLRGSILDSDVSIGSPLTYFPVFEYVGVPVQAYDSTRIEDRFSGTSPGLISLEQRRSIQGVQGVFNVTNMENTGTSKGAKSQYFGVRVYSRDVLPHGETDRIVSCSFTNVITPSDTPAAGKYIIPIMSDKSVVYAQDKE
jgi:hypothetical protein